MRMWIGKEMEGPNTGNMTLFVESQVLDDNDITLINQSLKKYLIRYLYLGAGRINTYINLTTLKKLIADIGDFIHITLEGSDIQLLENAIKIADKNIQVVYRIDLSSDADLCKFADNKLIVKLDDKSKVLLSRFKSVWNVDVSFVNKGLYKDVDTLIYEK